VFAETGHLFLKLIVYCVEVLGSLPNSLTLIAWSVDCSPKYTTGNIDEVCGVLRVLDWIDIHTCLSYPFSSD